MNLMSAFSSLTKHDGAEMSIAILCTFERALLEGPVDGRMGWLRLVGSLKS